MSFSNPGHHRYSSHPHHRKEMKEKDKAKKKKIERRMNEWQLHWWPENQNQINAAKYQKAKQIKSKSKVSRTHTHTKFHQKTEERSTSKNQSNSNFAPSSNQFTKADKTSHTFESPDPFVFQIGWLDSRLLFAARWPLLVVELGFLSSRSGIDLICHLTNVSLPVIINRTSETSHRIPSFVAEESSSLTGCHFTVISDRNISESAWLFKSCLV